MNVPLFKVHMPETAFEPLKKTLLSGYIGQGPKVEEFERALIPWIGSPNGLYVNSCTSALRLAMRLAGVGPGSETISTPMSCTASNTPILEQGGKIVWADINPWTGNIDPLDVERKITPLTKAVVAVHWGGYPCEIDELLRITKKYGIALIEDAAHAFGAVYRGRPVGSSLSFATFSFQAIKHINTLEGGLLVCPSMNDYRRGKLLRWYGIDRDTPRKDLRCLHPRTLLRLADGTKMQVREFVRKRHPGPLLAVEEGGTMVPVPVTNWFKNRRGNRRMIGITTKGLHETREQTKLTMLTEDHKILTINGMVEAGHIRNGDRIATPFMAPSPIQRKIIVGSLLGDASMGAKTLRHGRVRRATLSETHSGIQSEYLHLKARSLRGLGTKVFEMAPDIPRKRPNGSISYYTPSLPSLSEFSNVFYPNGKKRVAKVLVAEEFSPLLLAAWYLDDGHTNIYNQREGIVPFCELATNGFPEDDVRWLANLLSGKGFQCDAKNHSGWRIFFTKDGSRRLIDAIAHYVPTSLAYKVAHEPAAASFRADLWGDGSSVIHYDEAIVVEDVPWNGRDVFCLEVGHSAHNFVTSAAIVSNCEEDVVEAGYKYNGNDCGATIGLDQLNYVAGILARHRANAEFYRKALDGLKRIKLLRYEPDRLSAYWLFTIRVDDRAGFQKHMKDREIMVSQVHVRNDIHTAFREFRRNLPWVDEFAREQVSIPVGWWVTDQDREKIVHAVLEWEKT